MNWDFFGLVEDEIKVKTYYVIIIVSFSRRMLVGGAARRLRGRGWPVRDDVSALTGHVHRLVPSLRRLDLLRLLLALHLHRRRRRLPDRQGRLLRSARRSKLQNPIRAQEGQASQTNRFIYCPRQTHCKFRTPIKYLKRVIMAFILPIIFRF